MFSEVILDLAKQSTASLEVRFLLKALKMRIKKSLSRENFIETKINVRVKKKLKEERKLIRIIK